MLAMKSILAQKRADQCPGVDEIDANVGGRLGSKSSAESFASSPGHHQVLCITHLPQIAA